MNKLIYKFYQGKN